MDSNAQIENQTLKLKSKKNVAREINKARKMAAELFLAGQIESNAYEHLVTNIDCNASFESNINTTIILRDFDLERRQYNKDKRKRSKQRPRLEFEFRDFTQNVPLNDFRNLILYSALRNDCPFKPQFAKIKNCKNLSQTVLVIVDCSDCKVLNRPNGEYDFFQQMDYVRGNFLHRFTISMSLDDDDFYAHFYRIPLTLLSRFHTNIDFPVSSGSKKDFLLTLSDMCEYGYNIPDPTNLIVDQYDIRANYFPSKPNGYSKLNEQSPIFALDCEMCMTAKDRHELTRISLIDEHYNVILDTLVKPENPIVDYLTRFSGITRAMLRNVKTTLHDVREMLNRILPRDAILCGHSLNHDLDALRVYHPYVVDIGRLFNLTGDTQFPTSLRNLTFKFLGEQIQTSAHGHCSIQDSYATMKLAKLKFDGGVRFGNILLGWEDKIRASSIDCANDSTSSLYDPIVLLENDQTDQKATSVVKRHSLPEFDDFGPKTKRPRLENDPKSEIIKSNLKLSCQNCKEVILEFNCLEAACICRQLARQFCSGCVFPEKHSKNVSNHPIKEENLSEKRSKMEKNDKTYENDAKSETKPSTSNDTQKTLQPDQLSVAEAFNFSRHTSESIFKLFERKKRTFLWIHNPKFAENSQEKLEIRNLAQKNSQVCCIEAKNIPETLDIYKAKYLQHNLNIVEMTMPKKGHNEFEKLGQVDKAVCDIFRATSPDSLVFVMFKLKSKAICCVKLRNMQHHQ